MIPFIINYRSQLIILLTAIAVSATLYFKGYNDAKKSDELAYNKELLQIKDDQLKKIAELNTKYDTAASTFETSLSTQKTITKVFHETAIKEIEKPVYSMCLITDDGVRALNEAARQLNATRINKSTK